MILRNIIWEEVVLIMCTCSQNDCIILYVAGVLAKLVVAKMSCISSETHSQNMFYLFSHLFVSLFVLCLCIA